MYRYFALVWNDANLSSVRALQSFGFNPGAIPAGWRTAYEAPGVLAIHTGLREHATRACLLEHNAGVVVGTVFDGNRDTSSRVGDLVHFDRAETHRIVATGGRQLIDRFWGSYFAIVRDEPARALHVFRDPTCTLPCYHASLNGVELFFSHIEDCVRWIPLQFTVDRSYIVRWLLYTSLTGRSTGLKGVEDLPGGERLTIAASNVTRTRIWDPVALASHRRFERADDAATALRSTVQSTVNAWSSRYRNIVHKLSGGLDSSIVAGCLAQAPTNPKVTYLNFSVDVGLEHERMLLPGVDRRTAEKFRAIAGNGDERYFARLIAERWNVRLIERLRSNDMDLARLWDVPLRVSPPLYFTMMDVDDIELEVARELQAEAFFSGQAGDSVLFATLQPFAAIDFAYLNGVKRDLWQHLNSTAALTRESLWSVIGSATRHGLLRRPYLSPISLLERPTFLKRELLQSLTHGDFEVDLGHPGWESSLPPGKRNHIKGLASSVYHKYVFHSAAGTEHIDPLNSQPVWELMLQIPSYVALTGGVNRGLARRAFAQFLPAEIRSRQMKGTGMPFYNRLVRRNLGFLRDRLADGRLVEQGYLDRQKLLACLTSDEPFSHIYAPSLLAYLSAENWLEQWDSRGHQAVAKHTAAL